jgi:hypothetical protein
VRAQGERVLRFAWWGGGSAPRGHAQGAAALRAAPPRRAREGRVHGLCNGYLERLTTQIAGGSEPDLMQINWAWLAMFSKRGNGFADLRQHERHLQLDQFSADDLAYGDVAGKLNALPVSFSARVLLWNASSLRPRRPGAARQLGQPVRQRGRLPQGRSARAPTRSTASSTTCCCCRRPMCNSGTAAPTSTRSSSAWR